MQYIKISLVSEKFDPRTILFLFKCPKFNAFRRELLLTVSTYVESSGMIHYQMKVMKSFSGQFINTRDVRNELLIVL